MNKVICSYMNITSGWPILQHIHEIRNRIVYIFGSFCLTCIVCYCYKEELFFIYAKPFGTKFIYTNLTEAFTTYIQLAVVTAILILYPIVLYHVWSFLLPGLYLYEKKILRTVFVISVILYLISTTIEYNIMLPIAYDFFQGFQLIGLEKAYNIELQAKIHDYFVLSSKLIFAFSFCFQLPIVILVSYYISPKTYIWIKQKRRLFYISCLIVATLITPPDVFSQLIVVLPLIIFFELSLFNIKLLTQYNKETQMETIGIEPTT